MTEGLRIGRISVEGFKGFSEAQEIDTRNRHVFLVGPNGNGKSSIVEAIRWGLFGSTNRPNDIVKNEGYGGDCRVEIDLERDGKKWRLRRILNPGGSGSRAELFDEGGAKHSIGDVLPQMDSLDAGEGTHIIFNPQSDPLRRQPEDLTPFERTVFDHLGLKHPRAMLSHLETFVQEQEDEENSLGGLVGDARRRIDSRIKELVDRRGRILASPPWGGDLQPSRQDTERKARNLIRKIKTAESGNDFSQFSLGALVDAAERAVEERIDLDRRPLDQTLEQLNDKLRRLEPMREADENIAHKKEDLRKARESLLTILDGLSMDELQERVQRERQEARTRDLTHRLGKIAAELVDRTRGAGSTPCPICGTKRGQDELETAISAMVQLEREEDVADVGAAEDQWNTAQQIERDVQKLSHEIDGLRSNLREMIAAQDDNE